MMANPKTIARSGVARGLLSVGWTRADHETILNGHRAAGEARLIGLLRYAPKLG